MSSAQVVAVRAPVSGARPVRRTGRSVTSTSTSGSRGHTSQCGASSVDDPHVAFAATAGAAALKAAPYPSNYHRCYFKPCVHDRARNFASHYLKDAQVPKI
jgi:hypothetical protein